MSLSLSLKEEELHESTDIPQPPNTTTSPDNLWWIFCEGEKVRVDSDESVAKKLQDESVGWHDNMRHVNNRFLLHFCSVQHPEQYHTGTINAI